MPQDRQLAGVKLGDGQEVQAGGWGGPEREVVAPVAYRTTKNGRPYYRQPAYCYGPTRTEVYEPLPKWRRGVKRPSCLDLMTLLRKPLADAPHTFPTATATPTYPTMVGTAAA